MKNARRLSDAAVEALRAAVQAAMGKAREYLTREVEQLADLYTGRSKGGTAFFGLRMPSEGMPMEQYMEELRSGVYNLGGTTLNLLTSRLMQIAVASTPGRPTLSISAKNGAAARLAEQQEELVDFWVEGSRMEEAVRRAAWLDPVQPYVGVRLGANPRSLGVYDRIKWQVIEAEHCGYEPHARRFKWHARVEQWGALGSVLQAAIRKAHEEQPTLGAFVEPQPWEPVALTEVFDEFFAVEADEENRKDCRVHVFANVKGQFYRDKRNKRPDLGLYVTTHDLRCSPLVIEGNLQPAALEDIPPVEAAQWVGILDSISDTVEQIRREVQGTNNEVLYDANAITQELLKQVIQQPAGKKIYIPVIVTNDARGISHVMRPVERNSILGELITALQTQLAMLDDVTGVGPQDRGLSVNPSKSATEASVLSASSSRRTAARLGVQANRWENMARVVFEYQRDYYGKEVEIAGGGTVRVIPVPSAEQARFGFKVALDEMENLSRRGRLDTHMMIHTILIRDAATFANGVPKLVRESERRLLKSAGWTDIDLYLDRPVIEGGPEDRYIAALENDRDIEVYEDDDHALFIAYYGKILEKAVLKGGAAIPVASVQNAIRKHQVFFRQRQSAAISSAGNPSPIPGVSAQGEVDNSIAQQLQAGLPIAMNPQILGQ